MMKNRHNRNNLYSRKSQRTTNHPTRKQQSKWIKKNKPPHNVIITESAQQHYYDFVQDEQLPKTNDELRNYIIHNFEEELSDLNIGDKSTKVIGSYETKQYGGGTAIRQWTIIIRVSDDGWNVTHYGPTSRGGGIWRRRVE